MRTFRWLVPPTEEERRQPFRTELFFMAMPLSQRIIAIITVALLGLLFTLWMVAMVSLVREAWDERVKDPRYRLEWDYERKRYEYEIRPPKDVRDAGAFAIAQEMREWAGEEETTNIATNK